ncbi:MAG: GTP-binding protein [Candidatus Nitrosocaldus sp.]
MHIRKVIIMGAAGRDFHNFNVFFRDNPRYRVVAFTAAQIPYIENRVYPPELAGSLYPQGIPIYPEHMLEELIEQHRIDDVFFSYSDVSHEHVMHIASRVLAAGASFTLLGSRDTQLEANKPVIAVVATRTGAGKSTITRLVADVVREENLKPVIVRHPMPYNNFYAVQHFKSMDDLARYELTLEEEEEYIVHIENGYEVLAGVDYARVLEEAEKHGDIILWDGGNNDMPFYRADHTIVVTDATRVGHELLYHPGEANLRAADTIVINKINLVDDSIVKSIVERCNAVNPDASIFPVRSEAYVDEPERVKGKRVVIVEDAPSITHGEMREAAGSYIAKALNCSIVDPRAYAVGSIRDVYSRYPWIGNVIPAMGYSKEQMLELEHTLNAVDCDAIILATPADIARRLRINKPVARVRFAALDASKPGLREYLKDVVTKMMH